MAIKPRFRENNQTGKLSKNRRIKSLLYLPLFFLCLIAFHGVAVQSIDSITRREITFTSEGIILVGTLFSPTDPQAAIVLVHGSGQEKRMNRFAERVAKRGFPFSPMTSVELGNQPGFMRVQRWEPIMWIP